MTLSPLAPVRHKQSDFFIAEIFDNLPWKDDLASMEHPLFTLSTKQDMRLLKYTSTDGTASIEMQPSMNGLPNIMDKDVLLYCASVVMAKVNEGGVPPQSIRLSLRDMLIATNRNPNNDGYKYIKKALNRLTGCMLKTTIKTGRTTQGEMFHLIEKVRYLESERVKDRLIGVEVTLSDWFYNSLVAKEVLSINKDYFRIRKPLERRLYEIARKHCGNKKLWKISLEKLHLKSGSTARLPHFRNTIKKLAESHSLLDYAVHFDAEKDLVSFAAYSSSSALVDDSPEVQGNLALPDFPLPENIPPSLLEDARHAVGVGLDYYQLWYQYINWSGSKTAKNLRGGFIGFCRMKAGKMAAVDDGHLL